MKQRAKKSSFNEMAEKNLLKRLEGIKKKEEREERKKQRELNKVKKSVKPQPEKPVKKGGRKKANALTAEEILKRKAERKERKKNIVNHLIGKRNKKKGNKEREKQLMVEQKQRQIINPDLFKCGLDFQEIFTNPQICIDYIEKYILKSGQPVCRRCNEETQIYKFKKRPVYKCKQCQHQFRITTGTIFHNSKVSLKKWFYLLLQEIISSNKLNLTEASKHINVSKRSCHRLLNKIRSTAFSQHHLKFKQNCTVAIDTTAFFGKNVNRHDHLKFTKKETFALSTQTLVIKENNGISKGIVIDSLKEDEILKVIRENVPMGATIHTDEHKSFGKLNAMGFKHETVNHSKGEHGRGNVSNNGAESFNSILKIASICHRNRISKKYLQQFINSVSFATNVNAARLTLCEQFFLAIENIIYDRKPKKQIANLRMIYHKSELIDNIVQMVNFAKQETA